MAQHNIIAFFETRADAERARDAIVADGISSSSVRFLPDTESGYTRSSTTASYDYARDEGGFYGMLGELNMPEDDRYAFAEGMSRGLVALLVMADEADYDRISDLLDRYGSVDLDARESEWRQSGWTGYEAGTTAATTTAATGMASDRVVGRDEVIPVVEEQIRVGKRAVEGGRVRVRSYVVETPVEAQVDLMSRRVSIERRPVDRPVSSGDAVFREQTIEAVERREEAVVGKEARVVEEIGLRQQAEVHTEIVRDTVRKTEVEVEDERVEGTRARDDSVSDTGVTNPGLTDTGLTDTGLTGTDRDLTGR